MFDYKLANLGPSITKAEAELNRLSQEEGWVPVTVFHNGAIYAAYLERERVVVDDVTEAPTKVRKLRAAPAL